jgi:hypothetical protein
MPNKKRTPPLEIRQNEIQISGTKLLGPSLKTSDDLFLLEVTDERLRKLFDDALDIIHYSKSCKRVGRCMRLAITCDKQWVGGIVLGSPFPNILVRDEAIGLRKYVTNYKLRGLKNPWSRDNVDYWTKLQQVVNHARTFIFPKFQGKGIGIRAHGVLLGQGIKMWQHKYHDRVRALDTLCTAAESKLFLLNGWKMVGETKGYTLDKKSLFSKRLKQKQNRKIGIVNNCGLLKPSNPIKWVVWVYKIKNF